MVSISHIPTQEPLLFISITLLHVCSPIILLNRRQAMCACPFRARRDNHRSQLVTPGPPQAESILHENNLVNAHVGPLEVALSVSVVPFVNRWWWWWSPYQQLTVTTDDVCRGHRNQSGFETDDLDLMRVWLGLAWRYPDDLVT